MGGSLGYRAELRGQRHRVLVLLLPAVAGSILGSALLLSTPTSAFDAIVPFLILFACAVLALQTPLSRFAETHQLAAVTDDHVPIALRTAVFIVAIYGGYFGAGLGIMTLALLTVLMPDDLQRSNALKGLLALIINAVRSCTSSPQACSARLVRWGIAGVMALGAIIGGYLGVGIARKLGREWLRVVVIAYGVVSAVVLLLR